MFGISSTELMIIVIFGFLLFGPDKLPQIGRTLGRALRQFRETQEKMTSVVQSEVIDPMTAAAAAPVKPKKSGSSSTSSTAEDDSDLDSVGEPTPRRKETFAERRARLAAEKAEQEAAEQSAQSDEVLDGAVDAQDAPSPEQAEAATPSEQDEQEAEVRATEDLYARRPRKKSRPVSEPTDEAAAAEEAPATEGGDR